MQIYKVGGYVRDNLIGIKPKDCDYVVVGSSHDDMIAKGFKCVGKGFPVYIHPITGNEYALARTERKTGNGYNDFEFDTDDITLDQDLARRDITINSIAEDIHGILYDPCGGRNDINYKIIRHNSGAFSEDPLRVLRVARFYAMLYGLGFRIDKETIEEMKKILKTDLISLTPDRIWIGTEKALKTSFPTVYFETLRECGALEYVFPELHALIGKLQNRMFHGEGDAWDHAIYSLKIAQECMAIPEVKFAVLVHDIGKGSTPIDQLPKHHGHEEEGERIVNTLCKRLNIPSSYRDLALISARYHMKHHKVLEMTPQKVLKLLKNIDAFRKKERFYKYIDVCGYDFMGRICMGQANTSKLYPQAMFLRDCVSEIEKIDINGLASNGYSHERFLQELHTMRLAAINKIRRSNLYFG